MSLAERALAAWQQRCEAERARELRQSHTVSARLCDMMHRRVQRAIGALVEPGAEVLYDPDPTSPTVTIDGLCFAFYQDRAYAPGDGRRWAMVLVRICDRCCKRIESFPIEEPHHLGAGLAGERMEHHACDRRALEAVQS